MRQEKKRFSLFYKVLLAILLVLLLIFCYIRFGLLRPWLTRFEAAQPKHTSQQVFQNLFSPADWGRVYDLSSDLPLDREGFVQAMEELAGNRELTLVETSAGLSGNRRYLVKAGNDSLACFTLSAETQNKETRWRLNGVELLVPLAPKMMDIQTLAGQRVLVDGRELGEDCQVRLTETAAERYLPEGVQGRRTVLWQTRESADVAVLNADGEKVPLTYDEAARRYTVEETPDQPTDQERAALTGAAKTYARYMIRQSTPAQLKTYFDSGSAIYRTICSSEIWIKQTSGHTFSNEEISQFTRYGEDLFSARVSMHLDVRRGNGSAKPYEIDSTFFFHKKNGAWRAFDMTNMDVQEETVHTRLVFLDGERELGRLFVSSKDHSFTPPVPPEHPGQRFAGWAIREQQGANVTMTILFRPDGAGSVTLPSGYSPEPMALYAAFEQE